MKRIFAELRRLPEFERDLKKLVKRYRTLEDDVQNFIETQLFLFHKLDVDNQGVFQLSGLGVLEPRVFKAKKFACRSLKGSGAHSGIRIIYAYSQVDDRVDLIEIYFKGDKENEDRERIRKFLSTEN